MTAMLVCACCFCYTQLVSIDVRELISGVLFPKCYVPQQSLRTGSHNVVTHNLSL